MAQILDLGKIRFNWAGSYGALVEYSYNDLVKYGPNLYAYTANVTSTGVLPTDGTKWAIVTEGIFYKGLYTSGVKYYRNDIVIDGTNTYITVTEHTASSNVAAGNANLEIIALGQEGLPNQSGKTNRVLSTDGTSTTWANTTYLTKQYVGNSQGQAAVDFESSGELTNVIAIGTSSASDFAQFSIVNTTNSGSASTDFISYTADGNNTDGFIDMGITSRDFDAAAFGITGPHDGYIFMSAPRGATSRSVTSYTVVAGTVTLTTQTAHAFTTGDDIVVFGVSAQVDGTRVVTATPNSTKVSFVVAGATAFGETATPDASVHTPTGEGNLVFATDGTGSSNKIVFAAGGYQSGTTQMCIIPNESVEIEIDTDSTSATTGALVVDGGAGFSGAVSINGLIRLTGKTYLGAGAEAFETAADLTSANVVITSDANGEPFTQIAFKNVDAESSADFQIYNDIGTDASGWLDMGMTGSEFEQAEFGLTGPNEGYIFFSAPDGVGAAYDGTGNLTIATSDAGTENAIIFGAGGFTTGRAQMSIIPDDRVHIEIDTPSTSPTTGALTVVGGVGIVGDVNIAGNIVFGGEGTQVGTANLAVTAPFIFTGDGNTTQNYDLGLITEGKYVVSGSVTGIPTRYVVNKVLQTNVATITTKVDHKFLVGDSVTIASVDATFNGTYTIASVPNSTNFTYAKTASDVASTRIGDETFTINQRSLVANVATLQTTVTHTYQVGDSVVVTGTNSTFNGTFTITAVTANTFSYAKTSINVTAESSSGTSVVNRTVATAIVASATRTRYNAIYKDRTDKYIKFITNISTKPSETIDLAQATYGVADIAYDNIKVGGIVLQGGANEGGSLTFQGDIRKAAWTTDGVRHISVASTLTDTTSTGTVAAAYTNVIGGNTIAAVSSATYTEYGTMWVKTPTAGTNVTFTNRYSVVTDGAVKFGGTLKQVGAATFDSTVDVTGNVNVNSNKFNVTAANGNTAIAGTLAVTGGTTLSSTLAVNSAVSTLNGGISSSGTVTLTGGVSMSGTVDVQELRETTVDVTLASNVGTLDWTAGNIYYIGTAPTGAMTFNVTNVPTDTNKIMTINVFVVQAATGYIPTTFQIAGAAQTVRWPGGTAPTATSTAGKIDIFSFTLMRTSGGAWIVYGSSSLNY
jgi:hypothetical protein